jgi:uncharacterized protein YdeI (YjbR/CyaY-like superfamily)
MKKKNKPVPTVVVRTIEDWRSWLRKNHLGKDKVELISYKKHTNEPFISQNQAMLEAIRYGWIDTTGKRLDENRFIRTFVRRGPNANWSKNTLRYAGELAKKGLMSDYGLSVYLRGMKKKPHDHGIPDNPRMPKELARALAAARERKNFDAYAPSYKKMVFRWILKAKRVETKEKRIEAIVKAAGSRARLFYDKDEGTVMNRGGSN